MAFNTPGIDEKNQQAFLEKAKDEEQEQEDENLLVQRGDTINALINHRWVSMAVIAFIIGVLIQRPTLIAISAFLLVIVTAAWLWSRNTLINISYQRRFYHTRAFPGETTEVEIILENKKWLPLTWLQVEDEWPKGFAPVRTEAMVEGPGDPTRGALVNAYSLRWNERVRRRYELEAIQRGVYEIGPLSLLSGDPFSLFERLLKTNPKRDYLVVYPEIKPLGELGFPLKDPFGDRRVQRRLFEDPNRVIGVRDYQPQDSFRTIHWKATARTGDLQTKVFEPTRGTSIVLAVNIATFEEHWRGVWPEMMEYTLSTTASIANWAAGQDYGLGLICNGALFRSDQAFRIQPSRRSNQLGRVLEALAGVKYYVTDEFGRYVINESPKLPIGATMVVVTPFISRSIAISSMRLRDSGRRVVWVVLGKQKPEELHGIQCYHLPITTDEPTFDDDGDIQETEDVSPARRETARDRFLRERAREEAHRRRHELAKEKV
jgi:uncharacterized protein (DUF58 family)